MSKYLALLCFTAHLSSADDKPPLILRDVSVRDEARSATVIVLIMTKAFQLSSDVVTINWPSRPGISSSRLVKVGLQVEQVIAGEIGNRDLQVMYWAPETFTQAGSLDYPVIGEIAVHYLIGKSGILRYVRDLIGGKTMVYFGSHINQSTGGRMSPETKIIDVLLTPGAGINVDSFANHLGSSVSQSLLLAGFTETFPFVRKLLSYRNPLIQWKACVSLYEEGFVGQDGCVDGLITNPLAASRSAELKHVMDLRKASNDRFSRAFLADPLKTVASYSVLPGRDGLRDFLGLIATHPDPKLAAKAKAELGSLNAR